MSTVLVEVDNFDTSIVVPEDGIDLRTAASVVTPVQALTNRTKNLNLRTTHDHGLLTDSRHMHFPITYWPATEWSMQWAGSFAETYMLQNPVNSGTISFHIPLTGLPTAGWKISQARIYLRAGGVVHACASPPTVALYRQFDNGASVSVEQIGTTGTDDTTAAGYIGWHTLLVGGISGGIELEADSLYHLRITGENGVGAVDNLKCYGARVTLLVPDDYAY